MTPNPETAMPSHTFCSCSTPAAEPGHDATCQACSLPVRAHVLGAVMAQVEELLLVDQADVLAEAARDAREAVSRLPRVSKRTPLRRRRNGREEEYLRALDALVEAARAVDDAFNPHGEAHGYPEGLPSWDEHLIALIEWRDRERFVADVEGPNAQRLMRAGFRLRDVLVSHPWVRTTDTGAQVLIQRADGESAAAHPGEPCTVLSLDPKGREVSSLVFPTLDAALVALGA